MESIKIAIKGLEETHAKTKELSRTIGFEHASKYMLEKNELFVYYIASRLLKIKDVAKRDLVLQNVIREWKHRSYKYHSLYYIEQYFRDDVRKLIEQYETVA